MYVLMHVTWKPKIDQRPPTENDKTFFLHISKV